MKDFPVWKTITLGTFKSVDGLQAALREFYLREIRGLSSFTSMEYSLLRHGDFSPAPTSTEVDLVKVSPTDLGFVDTYEYGKPRPIVFLSDMVSRALEYGLVVCPCEVGPQLRLQYENQPDNEWLEIVMKPLLVPNGEFPLHMVFSVISYCTNVLGGFQYQKTLHTWTAGPKGRIADERSFGTQLIFALPRQGVEVTT